MYIITFYSFKGGVGRTMALVNTGAELARRGRKVLLVDFDLEAPGLSTYSLLRSKKPHPGIVEYVAEFRHTHRSPSVTDFLYEVKGKKAKFLAKMGGRLWVMPAGRGDANYSQELNALNWHTLYREQEGFLLFEDTRLQWEADLQPDYVLIDARTGHSDIEGICTRQLADAVVVVFHPNEQNHAGLKEVCRNIRAEAESGLKKEIKLHFVASNVPLLDDEDGVLRKQLNKFVEVVTGRPRVTVTTDGIRYETLCTFPVLHRIETLQLLDQPIFVLQRPRSRLSREYKALVRRLIMTNPADREGTLLYLRSCEPRSAGLAQERWDSNSERHQQMTSQFWDDAAILVRLGCLYQHNGDFEAAERRFSRVLQLNPNWADALFSRGQCRRQMGDKDGAVADFLQYLRLSRTPAFLALPPGALGLEILRLDAVKQDEREVFRELMILSLDAFRQALLLPEVQEIVRPQPDVWLDSPAEFLIRERRWEDAIRYLESLKHPAHGLSEGNRAFYLAMAYWGKLGSLPPEVCGSATTTIPQEGAANLQRLSVLHWGLGTKNEPAALLDRALAESAKMGRLFQSISWWTFRESSVHEFRADCAEIRRMIQGEPVRPPFLGPQSGVQMIPANG